MQAQLRQANENKQIRHVLFGKHLPNGTCFFSVDFSELTHMRRKYTDKHAAGGIFLRRVLCLRLEIKLSYAFSRNSSRKWENGGESFG